MFMAGECVSCPAKRERRRAREKSKERRMTKKYRAVCVFHSTVFSLGARTSEKGKRKENCLARVFCIAALPFFSLKNREIPPFSRLIGKVVCLRLHPVPPASRRVCKFTLYHIAL
jgi:hypothetical protein